MYALGIVYVHEYEAVYGYCVDKILCSKHDKLVTEIYLESLGTKKHKKVKLAV